MINQTLTTRCRKVYAVLSFIALAVLTYFLGKHYLFPGFQAIFVLIESKEITVQNIGLVGVPVVNYVLISGLVVSAAAFFKPLKALSGAIKPWKPFFEEKKGPLNDFTICLTLCLGFSLMLGLIYGITLGIILGIIFSLMLGLILSLTVGLTVDLVSSLTAGFICSLIVSFFLGLFAGAVSTRLIFGFTFGFTTGLTTVLFGGLVCSLIVGLIDEFSSQSWRVYRRLL